MNGITQCPQCGTRFKVSAAQIEMHSGLVRCGLCQTAFNATHYLHEDEPSPQLILPISEDEEENIALSDSYSSYQTETRQQPRADNPTPEYAFLDKSPIAPDDLAANKRRWPWIMGILLLLVTLTAQSGYFFRVELAARLPGLKPVLESYCDVLMCTIPLPQKTDQLNIESSDMEFDPAQSNVIVLRAVLRNRAPYTLAYPHLELTLTNTADTTLARRIFQPADYLKSGESWQPGLLGNRDISIQLRLGTEDLKPSGYRIYLFYPS